MLLLDTNVVIWMAADESQISALANAAMVKSKVQGQGLAIAGATLWEIALLAAKGRLAFSPSVDAFLGQIEAIYHVLPMARQIALVGARFTNNYSKDPADRQIAATVLVHGMPLVTADKAIRQSGEVPCIW